MLRYKRHYFAVSMIREDLLAERIAIETYTEIARWLGEDDPTSRRLIEQILEKEEEHAEDLVTLLARLPEEQKKPGVQRQPKSG